MYFPLFEPYLNENSIIENFESNSNRNTIINNVQDDVCIICLEKKDSIKMKEYCSDISFEMRNSVKNYNIKCDCNYSIHPSCLNEWIKIKNSCPICKSVFTMTIREEEFTNDEYTYPIVIFYFLTGNHEMNHFMNRNIHFYIMYSCLKNLMILIIFLFYCIVLIGLLVCFLI